MTEPIWNQFLTERDKQVFAGAGYGARQGYGKRPALVIIDVNYASAATVRADPRIDQALAQLVRRGRLGWRAVIKKLLSGGARQGHAGDLHHRRRRDDNWDNGSWAWKNTAPTRTSPNAAGSVDGNEIVAEIAPEPQRPRDLQAEAERLLRHQLMELPGRPRRSTA